VPCCHVEERHGPRILKIAVCSVPIAATTKPEAVGALLPAPADLAFRPTTRLTPFQVTHIHASTSHQYDTHVGLQSGVREECEHLTPKCDATSVVWKCVLNAVLTGRMSSLQAGLSCIPGRIAWGVKDRVYISARLPQSCHRRCEHRSRHNPGERQCWCWSVDCDHLARMAGGL
jgi:hypothetical protein